MTIQDWVFLLKEPVCLIRAIALPCDHDRWSLLLPLEWPDHWGHTPVRYDSVESYTKAASCSATLSDSLMLVDVSVAAINASSSRLRVAAASLRLASSSSQ